MNAVLEYRLLYGFLLPCSSCIWKNFIHVYFFVILNFSFIFVLIFSLSCFFMCRHFIPVVRVGVFLHHNSFLFRLVSQGFQINKSSRNSLNSDTDSVAAQPMTSNRRIPVTNPFLMELLNIVYNAMERGINGGLNALNDIIHRASYEAYPGKKLRSFNCILENSQPKIITDIEIYLQNRLGNVDLRSLLYIKVINL